MNLTRHLLLCGSAALLAVSCQAPPSPSPGRATPSIAVPATPVPATPQGTLGQFQGRDSCQSGPPFEVRYALETWELQAETLVHRTIPGCAMQLNAIGQQVAGPKRQTIETLGGFSWEVSVFPNAGLTSYWLEEGGGCYLLSVTYSDQPSPEAAGQCQHAARRVVDSFAQVGG